MKKLFKKISLFKPLIIVLILIVLAVCISFAWFTNTNQSNIDPIDSFSIDAYDSRISMDGNIWKTSLEFDDGIKDISPVIGDGLRFFCPSKLKVYKKINQLGDVLEEGYVLNDNLIPYPDKTNHDPNVDTTIVKTVYSTVDDGFREVTGNELDKSVFSVNFFFKNSHKTDLFLDDTSIVTLMEPRLEYLAGSVRVMLFKKIEDVFQPILVWIPNTNYHLSKELDENNREQYVFLNNSSDYEDSYKFYSSVDHETYNTVTPTSLNCCFKDGNTLYLFGDISTGSNNDYIKNNPIDTSLDIDEFGNYTDEYKLVLWVDGEDRECQNITICESSIMGSIKFKSVKKEE